MRRSWVYFDGIAYEKGVDALPVQVGIVPEIEPYRSMVTGEIITSRAKHREHLRRHGMTEIGNDSSIYAKPKPISAASQTRKELLIAQVNAMTNEQFRQAGRRELDNLRWNNRQD